MPKRFLSENLRMTNAWGAAAVDMVRELWLEELYPAERGLGQRAGRGGEER